MHLNLIITQMLIFTKFNNNFFMYNKYSNILMNIVVHSLNIGEYIVI